MNKFIFTVFFVFLISFSNPVCARELLKDNLVDTTLKNQEIEKPVPHLIYNYQDTTRIPIKLSVTKEINSENDVYEGQIIKFRVKSDVVYKGKTVITKDTVIPARVETIIDSGMNGIPASVIIGNFKSKTFHQDKLQTRMNFSDRTEAFGFSR